MKNYPTKFLAIIAAVLFASIQMFAQNGTADEKDLREAETRARNASKAFNEIMRKSDKAIPRELLDRAEAVAVFPGVVKAAFIVGGRSGEGLISRRTATGWSAPAFFKLGGGSFGFQFGADKTDYIMLFLNDGGIKGLLEDKFEFGADAGLAAGPIGREASATTNATLDAGILSYSRSRGAFVGVALKGSRIAPNNEVNQALYSKTAKQLLDADVQTPLPDSVKSFPTTLSRYSTRKNANSNNTNATRQRTAGAANPNNTVSTETENSIVIGSAPRTNPAGVNPNLESGANAQIAENANTVDVAPTANNSNAAANNNSYNVGRSAARPTNKLAREIRSELLELPYYDVFDWLEFEILADNTIVLRGFTTRPATKSAAENVTKEVAGVAAVRNEIELLPPSSNDDNLRAALYRAVYSGQLFRYGTGAQQPIHIIVNRGRVTLKGVVDNESDKNFANIQANGVSGVFEVRNELVISSRDEKRL